MRVRVADIVIIALVIFILSAGLVSAKPIPEVRPLHMTEAVRLGPDNASPTLSLADTCLVYMGDNPAYLVYPWVEGDELFKAYQDPAVTCTNPYPFTIDAVSVYLYFAGSGTIYLAGDIEALDPASPTCTRPGDMLAITQLYEISIPAEDLYYISIPLDTPLVVNGDYFVGLYVAAEGNPDLIAVVVDSIPAGCVSYNDWGYGYVDLDTVYTDPDGTGAIKTFPGRLALFSEGFPGGGSGPGDDTSAAPAAEFIIPEANAAVGSTVDLWANDAAGSSLIDGAEFFYYFGGTWSLIGTDPDDDPPLRNGVTPSGSGNGLAITWTTAGLNEGDYPIRAVVSDTLGRADTAQVTVRVDPTPLAPVIDIPALAADICGGVTVQLSCSDEDISYMQFYSKSIPMDNNYPMPVISQSLGGDYCSGPATAAMAVKYWSSKGYPQLLTEGVSTLSDAQLIDRFVTAMRIESNAGCHDEEFVSGLIQYVLAHGAGFSVKIDRTPGVADLYSWLGDFEYAVMVGLSGTTGLWMPAAGFAGVVRPTSEHTFRFVNPVTSQVLDYAVKEDQGKLLLNYNGEWKEIDIIVGLVPDNWSVSRTSCGFDGYPADGWGFYWDTAPLSQERLYFLYVTAFDGSGHTASSSILLRNDCNPLYTPGDVNDDGLVNPGDLIYLINYLYLGQAAPPAGAIVADINCDASINLADIIYLYRHFFYGGPAPCL